MILFASSIISIVLAKKAANPGSRVFFTYLHLALLLSPFLFFAFSMNCEYRISHCATKALALTIISGIFLAFFLGYFVLPYMYANSLKGKRVFSGKIFNFASETAKKLELKTPRIYLADSAKPFAFSFFGFNPVIFLSVGMLDILNAKEIEAVVLHEFGHLSRNSSALKFANFFTSAISPFSKMLLKDSQKEEGIANMFAIKEQGTSRFLESAKKKCMAV